MARGYIYSTTGYIVNAVVSETLWSGNTIGTSGAEKSKIEYAYDGLGIGVTPLKGNTTLTRNYIQVSPSSIYIDSKFGYDNFGRVITSADGNNNVMTSTYNSTYGYAEIVTNTLGHVVTTINDPKWGVPIRVTDPNGNVTVLQNDAYGRRIKVWRPTEPITGVASAEYIYSVGTRPAVVQKRQLLDLSTSIYLNDWTYYDGLGRFIQTQRADPSVSRVLNSKAYDNQGRDFYVSSSYSATGTAGNGYITPTWSSLMNYQVLSYDERGHQIRNEAFSQGTARWSQQAVYDGWSKIITDANSHIIQYDNDAFGKIITATEFNTTTQVTRYSYDLQGNLRFVTDSVGNTTTITSDLIGRNTGLADPDMGVWQYSYDNTGNLTSQSDGRNLSVFMEYDQLNRLIRKRKDTAGTGTILSEWQYDASGQKGLLSWSKSYDLAGTTQVNSVSYDARNRVTQQQWVVPSVNGGTFRFDYGYDAADHQTIMRYPGGSAGQQGEIVTQAFHTQTGQLRSVVSDDGTRLVDYINYNPQGQLVKQRNDSGANGLTKTVVYDDALLRISTLSASSGGSSTNLQLLNYQYDFAGMVGSIANGLINEKQCFNLDSLNRLIEWRAISITPLGSCTGFTPPGTLIQGAGYEYDPVGNILSKEGNAYSYGSAKPHAVTAAYGNSYSYDFNGNQITRTISGTTYGFSFDYQNRLSDVKLNGTKIATYTYDADGNRVLGMISGAATVYIAGIYEYQNGATTKYYEGSGMRRTGYAVDNGVKYLLKDYLGSSTVIVNQNGTVQASNSYYPYGGNRGGSAFSDITTKRFTGQYHEAGLPGGEGLSYYNARWYDAQLGNFISPDSLIPGVEDPQNLNHYAYAGRNPANNTDPTGHWVDKGPGDNGYWRNDTPELYWFPDSGAKSHCEWCAYRAAVNKGKIKSWFTPKLAVTVKNVARRFALPAKLLAASTYAEMNSRTPVDDIQDAGLASLSTCESSPSIFSCGGNILTIIGAFSWILNPSVGLPRIKPTTIMDEESTLPALRAAGYKVPSNSYKGAIQALDMEGGQILAAAYLKGLADLRMEGIAGTGNPRYDMSKLDMQMVRVAYNGGVGQFRTVPGGFRGASVLKAEGVGVEASPWLDAFGEIYGE